MEIIKQGTNDIINATIPGCCWPPGTEVQENPN